MSRSRHNLAKTKVDKLRLILLIRVFNKQMQAGVWIQQLFGIAAGQRPVGLGIKGKLCPAAKLIVKVNRGPRV